MAKKSSQHKDTDLRSLIIHGSCEDLSAMQDESISLTITSPPYWNAIDYDLHESNSASWYRTRKYSQGYQDYEEYLAWLERIFKGILDKTKPGGFCAIVIGTVLFKGRHYPVPFDTVSRLTSIGWEFHQDIIWHKVTGGVKRAGVFIQKPFPGYFYPNIMTEYIMILRKPGAAVFRDRKSDEKESARLEVNRLFTMDIANTVWHIAPVPPGHLDHPCPFPEEIPHRLTKLFSYPGELVFDPFVGSGQTLKVARHLGRRVFGYETLGKYVNYAVKRMGEPLSIRPQQIIATFEKIGLQDGLAGPSRKSTRYSTRKHSSTRPLSTVAELFAPNV